MPPNLQPAVSSTALERAGDLAVTEVYSSVEAAVADARADDRAVFLLERQEGVSLARELKPFEPDHGDGMLLYAEVDRAGVPTGAAYGALYPYLRAIAKTNIAGVLRKCHRADASRMTDPRAWVLASSLCALAVAALPGCANACGSYTFARDVIEKAGSPAEFR